VLLSAFLPVPSPLIYAAAGWAGLRLLPSIILDLIGSAACAALLAVLGYLMGASGVAAANLVSHYAIASITGLTAFAIAPHARHALRSRRASWARSRAVGSRSGRTATAERGKAGSLGRYRDAEQDGGAQACAGRSSRLFQKAR
jgi:hypothetical protein